MEPAETAPGAAKTAPGDGETGRSRPTTRDLLVWGTLALGMLAVIGLGLLRGRGFGPVQAVPVLGELPAFELIDQDGRPIGLGDLAGSPWVADFIFTRCKASCLVMSERMRHLGERLGPESPVRRVSISVDPGHDTPEVLRAYAERYHAGAGWLFLTGERDRIVELSMSGFKLGLDDSGQAGSEDEPIIHSTRFVLVDGRGRLRGYYDGFDDAEIERLLREARSLLAENPS